MDFVGQQFVSGQNFISHGDLLDSLADFCQYILNPLVANVLLPNWISTVAKQRAENLEGQEA